MDWREIDHNTPWDTEVMLTGDSGYVKPHNTFIINGYRKRDWHAGEWNDVAGDPLRDRGWAPTHWAPMPTLPW